MWHLTGLEQGISFIEDGISCKNIYMYVFCLKYILSLPGMLSKYEYGHITSKS